tara:strand:- start:199 stop:528 length:330 start_codon:yes stop_codon:yes gene_type:complete
MNPVIAVICKVFGYCMACIGSAVQIRIAPLAFSCHTKSFLTSFSNKITFATHYPILIYKFLFYKSSKKYFVFAKIKSLNWIAKNRQKTYDLLFLKMNNYFFKSDLINIF